MDTQKQSPLNACSSVRQSGLVRDMSGQSRGILSMITCTVCLQVTDPYLNLFRGIVPPLLGAVDFTPLFGFMILQFLAGALDVGAEDEW